MRIFGAVLTLLFLAVGSQAGTILWEDDFNRADPLTRWDQAVDSGSNSFTSGGTSLIGVLWCTGSATADWYASDTTTAWGDIDFYFSVSGITNDPRLRVGMRDDDGSGYDCYFFYKDLYEADRINPNPDWYIKTVNSAFSVSPGDTLKYKLRGTGTSTTIDVLVNTTTVFSASEPETEYDTNGTVRVGIYHSGGSDEHYWTIDDLYVEDQTTGTPTATPTYTATPTSTASPTATPTFTATPTSTASPTATPTFTASPTSTASPTATPTFTESATSTTTPTVTNTPVVVYRTRPEHPMLKWLK